jgi:hypothetical protein
VLGPLVAVAYFRGLLGPLGANLGGVAFSVPQENIENSASLRAAPLGVRFTAELEAFDVNVGEVALSLAVVECGNASEQPIAGALIENEGGALAILTCGEACARR